MTQKLNNDTQQHEVNIDFNNPNIIKTKDENVADVSIDEELLFDHFEEAAEEIPSTEDNNDDKIIIEEDKSTAKKSTAKKYSKTEEEALSLGWQADYKGDKYRSAEEWLEWREASQKFRQQSKEIKNLKQTVEQLNNFLLNRYNEEQKTALADLKIKRDQAVEIGDYERFKKLDDEYQKAVMHQTQIKPVSESSELEKARQNVQQALEDPLVIEWLNKNPWARPSPNSTFDEKMMREWAKEKEQEYFMKNPNGSQYNALLYAEKAVRDKFPYQFNSSFKYNSVESSKPVSTKPKSPKITINDLPPKVRAVIRHMVRVNNGKITEQQYIDELIKTGAIKYE